MPSLKEYESTFPFTKTEAWKIYKLAAWAEAAGWTILLLGITINRLKLAGENISIPIAGQIHGTIFIAYFIAVIALYPSLSWKRTKTLFALTAEVPPYGSLLFEIYESRQQRKQKLTNNKMALVIVSGHKLVVMQPNKGIDWQLPCLNLLPKEGYSAAAKRLLSTFFGINAAVKKLSSLSTDNRSVYTVIDPKPIFKLDLVAAANNSPYVDEIALIDAEHLPKLVSNFQSS